MISKNASIPPGGSPAAAKTPAGLPTLISYNIEYEPKLAVEGGFFSDAKSQMEEGISFGSKYDPRRLEKEGGAIDGEFPRHSQEQSLKKWLIHSSLTGLSSRAGLLYAWRKESRLHSMIFFAMKDGERIYSLEMPVDDGPVHLPDLAKLGITDFQVKHPELSLREDGILFGFEHD